MTRESKSLTYPTGVWIESADRKGLMSFGARPECDGVSAFVSDGKTVPAALYGGVERWEPKFSRISRRDAKRPCRFGVLNNVG